MKLPNHQHAIVDIEKLRDYCLNTEHARGKHKARVFASALGVTAAQAESLRTTILEATKNEDAVEGEADAYGQRYTLDFEMVTGVGKAIVRTGWIVRTDEDFPRLTTC